MLAALYLDGASPRPGGVIRKLILGKEEEKSASRDYKTALQELIQRESGRKLTYRLVGEEGPDHAKRFAVEVELDGQGVGFGEGRTKKEAEQIGRQGRHHCPGGGKHIPKAPDARPALFYFSCVGKGLQSGVRLGIITY